MSGMLDCYKFLESFSNTYGVNVPFHLVFETSNETLRYAPKYDFHMSIKDFPHLLLEVNSQIHEGHKSIRNDRLQKVIGFVCRVCRASV